MEVGSLRKAQAMRGVCSIHSFHSARVKVACLRPVMQRHLEDDFLPVFRGQRSFTGKSEKPTIR